MCSTWLIIGGAVLEAIGLGIVFVQLAIIRSDEFGVPTPWTRLRAWWRKVRRRPQTISINAADSFEWADSARAKLRPGDLRPDADDADRIDRLERYVQALDRDVDDLHRRVQEAKDEAVAEAAKRDDQIRQETEAREAARREQVRVSLRWQAGGAACVLSGLILGTIGNLS